MTYSLTSLMLEIPVIQAPMAGGITTPELIAEVCNNGALGSLGAGYLSPGAIEEKIRNIRQLTSKPLNVNLFIPPREHSVTSKNSMIKFLEGISKNAFHEPFIASESPPISFKEQVEAVLDLQPEVFSFTFGLLDKKYVQAFQSKKILLVGTATTPQEASLLEESGVNAIVCQGYEAGGHRGGFLENDPFYTLATLLNLCRKKIKVPLIAAGGLMNGASILSTFALGAQYAQLGTVFIPTYESGACKSYKEALLDPKSKRTVVTSKITGKNARGIQNKLMDELEEKNTPGYPDQHFLTQPLRAQAKKENLKDWMSLWAGQSYSLCEGISVKQLLDRLKNSL